MIKIKEALWSYFDRLNSGIRSGKNYDTHNNLIIEKKTNPAIHIILFIITLFTTSFAGASSGDSVLEYIISGLPYSITLLTILLSHEFGHFFAARSFGVRATLPYFIPFPSIIGTMGAVIKIKSPIPDRRVLFYIGVSGLFCGFAVSLIAAIIGISMSQIKPIAVPGEDVLVPIFGDSLLYGLIIRLIHGAVPQGHDIYLSSFAWAGWIGFLVTSLNLMPVGQLDGSHILYALIGEKQKKYGWAVLLGLAVLSFYWIGWIIWILLVLAFLLVAHPPVDEGVPLSSLERFVGWLCMIIFFMTFIPVPVKFL